MRELRARVLELVERLERRMERGRAAGLGNLSSTDFENLMQHT